MNRDPDQQGLVMAGLGGTKERAEAIRDFGEGWVGMFRETKVYEIWNGSTDETLFDIHEPRYVFLIFLCPTQAWREMLIFFFSLSVYLDIRVKGR